MSAPRRHYVLALEEAIYSLLSEIVREAEKNATNRIRERERRAKRPLRPNERERIYLRQYNDALDKALAIFKQKVLDKLSLIKEAEESICSNLKKLNDVYYKPLSSALKRLRQGFIDAQYRTVSKLLISTSGGAFDVVFEVGIAWDMLLDVPYIPGSSLKGAVRSWALRRCSELSSVDERRKCGGLAFRLFGASSGHLASKDEKAWFQKIFGGLPQASEAWTGLATFYDAYPVSGGRGSLACGLLELDILTPHYYRGGNPVSDEFDVEPVPVPHLVVAPGTVFGVVASLDPGGEAVARSLAGLLEGGSVGDGLAAFVWMVTEALGEGIGARTGKGYGAMEKTNDYVFAPVSLRLHRRSGNLVWKRPE